MNIVTHITLRSPGDRASGIAKIHGRTAPNTGWWHYTQAEAIAMIRGGLYSFHVSGFTPTPAAVIVVEALRPYLKTEPDWTMQNNLLALPEWQ